MCSFWISFKTSYLQGAEILTAVFSLFIYSINIELLLSTRHRTRHCVDIVENKTDGLDPCTHGVGWARMPWVKADTNLKQKMMQ